MDDRISQITDDKTVIGCASRILIINRTLGGVGKKVTLTPAETCSECCVVKIVCHTKYILTVNDDRLINIS
jgi:hypothetical protein